MYEFSPDLGIPPQLWRSRDSTSSSMNPCPEAPFKPSDNFAAHPFLLRLPLSLKRCYTATDPTWWPSIVLGRHTFIRKMLPALRR